MSFPSSFPLRNPDPSQGRSGPARRDVLRALGLGAAGLSVGGLGLLTSCASDSSGSPAASGAGKGGSPSSTAAPARAVPLYDPDLPYWEQGNFRGVPTEEMLTDLEVTGAIPPELSGLFVRNGSNTPEASTLHWFLGDGMTHGVRIVDGKAQWYSNRYVQTPLAVAGKDLLNFGGIPGQENSQSNVALVHHAGKLLATGEVGWPYELNTDDLSTVGAWDFDGRLGSAMTAHPKIDPATGRMHFFGYDFFSPVISYYVADPSGVIDVVAEIPVDQATMIHDFAITDQDAVFWQGPVVFGADAENPLPEVPFHWDPAGPSRVGVMPLDGRADQIRWVDIPPCFVFHSLNAHRDGDDVVVLVHRLEDAFGRNGDLVPSKLTEWRIGTGGKDLTFTSTQLSDRNMDLPTHDRRHTGQQVRHGWCATTSTPDAEYGFELEGICHVDLQTGAEDVWEPGPNQRSGEGFFVPTEAGEGEGYVLTYIYDRPSDLSSLGIFDAQDMGSGPVAQVQLPVRVPFGFHGLWVDEAAL
ncbi:MAG: carotenoid oxygenase family protein [Aquihabitans sp.]